MQIIEAMDTLNFPTNKEGMCFSIATLANHAAIKGSEHFKSYMLALSEIQHHQTPTTLRLNFHFAKAYAAIRSVKELTSDDYVKYVRKTLEKKGEDVPDALKPRIEAACQAFFQEHPEEQKNISDSISTLEARHIDAMLEYDIEAVLNQVCLLHNTHQILREDNMLPNQLVFKEEAEKLGIPNGQNASIAQAILNGNITLFPDIAHSSAIPEEISQDELTTLLNKLKTSQHPTISIGMQRIEDGAGHRISVTYNKEQENWALTDSIYHGNHTYKNPTELLKTLFERRKAYIKSGKLNCKDYSFFTNKTSYIENIIKSINLKDPSIIHNLLSTRKTNEPLMFSTPNVFILDDLVRTLELSDDSLKTALMNKKHDFEPFIHTIKGNPCIYSAAEYLIMKSIEVGVPNKKIQNQIETAIRLKADVSHISSIIALIHKQDKSVLNLESLFSCMEKYSKPEKTIIYTQLVHLGLKLNTEDGYGEKLLDYAISEEEFELIDLLIKKGLDLSPPDMAAKIKRNLLDRTIMATQVSDIPTLKALLSLEKNHLKRIPDCKTVMEIIGFMTNETGPIFEALKKLGALKEEAISAPEKRAPLSETTNARLDVSANGTSLFKKTSCAKPADSPLIRPVI